MLARHGLVALAGGGDADGLERALRGAVAQGACGIISFGMAGALDPALRLGDMVVGSAVSGGFAGTCDAAWVAALVLALPGARVGVAHADGALCASAAAKARLFADGAVAVDMESHIAARVAAEAGLPFAILRCISDLAADDLPDVVRVAMAPGGRLALGAAAMSIMRQPGQLPALAHRLHGFNRAYGVLRVKARGLAGRLGFDLRGPVVVVCHG